MSDIQVYGYKISSSGLTGIVFSQNGGDHVAHYGSESESPSGIFAIRRGESSPEKVMILGGYTIAPQMLEISSLQKSEAFDEISREMQRFFPL